VPAEAVAVLINESMVSERDDYLGAKPHERTTDPVSHANVLQGQVCEVSGGHAWI